MLKITEKIRPFSHQPGTACLVPGTTCVVRGYPGLITTLGMEFPIHLRGAVQEFTVQMDLERDCVWIWGIAKEGHFRFKLGSDKTGLFLFVDRCPLAGLMVGSNHLHKKDKIFLVKEGHMYFPTQPIEKLSLGNWKQQDWDLIRRRNDVREWAPALYLLGQKTNITSEVEGGPVDLLEDLPLFFPASFSGILVPHLIDPLHQGLFLEEGKGDPFALLAMAYKKMRSFLIQGEQILPNLPPDWNCGRVLGLHTQYGTLDLEWTRGSVRQMVLHATKSGHGHFAFSKPIRSFRFNGEWLERDSFFEIEAGKNYHFDRFRQ